jgi:hypothetical protein
MFIIGPLWLIATIWVIYKVCCYLFRSKEERWLASKEREQRQLGKEHIRSLMLAERMSGMSDEQEAELRARDWRTM